MIAAVHVALIAAVALSLAKHWQAPRKLYWISFGFHLVAGVSVGLIYTYYYTANDTWFFFEDAKTLSRLAKNDLFSYLGTWIDLNNNIDLVGQDSRSMVFIRILSLVSLITGDNYWLCTAYFSLLSFAASWFLYRRIKNHFDRSDVAGALAFLIFPSVVFWSSGIEKETLTLTALYFLVGIFLQFLFTGKISWTHWPIAALAIYMLWTLKYYWAGVFFIAVIAGLATNYFSKQAALKKYTTLIYLVSFAFVGVGATFLHPNFYLHRFLEVVVANHDAFVQLSGDQSMIHFYQLSPTVGSMAINAPWAVLSGIFRPFIGEGQGALGLAASLENFLILILGVSFVWGNRKRFRAPWSVLLLTAMSYCIVLCVFLALSTPNLGTLSRYRVGFLPFLIFMLAYRNPLVDSIVTKLKS
jgi:hypothetical protein